MNIGGRRRSKRLVNGYIVEEDLVICSLYDLAHLDSLFILSLPIHTLLFHLLLQLS